MKYESPSNCQKADVGELDEAGSYPIINYQQKSANMYIHSSGIFCNAANGLCTNHHFKTLIAHFNIMYC